MKKKLLILISALIVLCMTVFIVGAAINGSVAEKIIDSILNGDDYLTENDLNGDGEVNILDVILGVNQKEFTGPKLTSLTLDDNKYNIEFSQNTTSYTVNLPAGRPRIPLVSATPENGASVDILQATIADTESTGTAKITVTNNKESNVYTINFVRAEVVDSLILQYEDRYVFTPDYSLSSNESFTFESSDTILATVDNDGVIVAKKVSSTPVVINAKVNGEIKDTLTINEIHKAQINLFFITGQSNAQGSYDYTYSSSNLSSTEKNAEQRVQAAEQLKDLVMPEAPGRVYCYDVYITNVNADADKYLGQMFDMALVKREGFAAPMGKEYYNLSGEKVVFLRSAYSGAPIERWLDPTLYPTLAESNKNHYQATITGYNTLINNYLTSDNFEIRSKANFWLQGETCATMVWQYGADWIKPTAEKPLMTDEDYANMFLKFNSQMVDKFGIESNNILLVRAHGTDGAVKPAITAIRASQYALGNNYSNITIVSRLSDFAATNTSSLVGTPYEPYIGMIGSSNVHYTQKGYNKNGLIAAQNYFYNRDADTNSDVTSVEIIDSNGVDRLASNTTIELNVGKTKRLAAFALPEYSLGDVIWSSSDTKVATVNIYGLITIVGEGDAVITATASNGVSSSVNVKGLPSANKAYHYRWDFNGNLSSNTAYDANDLNLSDLAAGTNKNYSFSNGRLISSNATAANRPDFTMTFPVTISSELDWTIEWKADFSGSSILLGQKNCATNVNGSTKYLNYLYVVLSGNYHLKFANSEGTTKSINYGSTYSSYNTKDYAWKLSYTKQSATMSLYVLDSDEWTLVGSVQPGTFEATFNNILGRYAANGVSNFKGEIDYIDIQVAPATVIQDAHYKWDFINGSLESTGTANTLYLTEQSVSENSTATFADDAITITSSAANPGPNYKMTEEVVLTREYDWSIEWKAKMSYASVLLGKDTGSANKNCIYIGLNRNGTTQTLRLDDDTGKSISFTYASSYSEAQTLYKALNTWKLEYVSSTNTMSLKLWNTSTSTWDTLATANPTTSQFEKVTFNTLFGRYSTANATANFYGTVDYIDIVTKKSVVLG